MSFETSLNHLLKIEGAYSHDPLDSGGETAWGITKDVAREFGYVGPMAEIPLNVVHSIYKVKYWIPLRLDIIDLISSRVAEELFDTGVNCGVSTAGRFLQASLNVLNRQGKDYKDLTEDGVIGNSTLNALRAYLDSRKKDGEIVLLRMLNCLQGARYVELVRRREKDETFIFGWFLNRIVI